MEEMAGPSGPAISFDYSTEMKFLFRKLIFISAMCCLATACDEDDTELSDVAVVVTPAQDTPVTLNSGEKALYRISVMTSHEYVASLKISSFDPQNGSVIHVERSVDKKEDRDISFTYTAPEINNDTTEVKLTFQAVDNLGNTASVTRKVTVVNKTIPVAEQTGIVLFDPSLGLSDALLLSDVSRPFNLADSPAPEEADIYIDSTTGFDDITWLSNTRTKFVRYNSFNYTGASASDIASVFRTSVPTDRVSDIQVNDIIIVGHGSKAEGVFLVVNILMESSAVRCMQMSYKGILYQDTENEEPEAPLPSGDE